MKTIALVGLALFSFGVAVGCSSTKCSVDCAPGYTADTTACTCLPLTGAAGAGGATGGAGGTGAGGSGAGGGTGVAGSGGAAGGTSAGGRAGTGLTGAA